MSTSSHNSLPTTKPHRWALLLACATFPLVWVGGLVTTTAAGMAVPDWPNTYGYNLFLYPWQTWLLGPWDLFIEHGHRLLGAVVGLLTMALLVSLFRNENRSWVRRAGVAALLLVMAQGVLGGLRVLLDERLLAMIHGCTGPLFFALTICLAVVTSKSWHTAAPRPAQDSEESLHRLSERHLQALALATCAFVYLQIVLGAWMRHIPVVAHPYSFATAVQFHLLMAGLITVCSCALLWSVWRGFHDRYLLRRTAWALAVMLVAQLVLGAGTWTVKYSLPLWAVELLAWRPNTVHAGGWVQTHIVTAHAAMGSLLLASSATLALLSLRRQPRVAPSSAQKTRHTKSIDKSADCAMGVAPVRRLDPVVGPCLLEGSA